MEIHVSGVVNVAGKQNREDILVNAAEKAPEESEILSRKIVSIGIKIVEPFGRESLTRCKC